MSDIENRYQLREILSFQMAYNKSSMRATWFLAIVIIGLFFAEEIFGGSQNILVLTRMGANVSELVKEGEYFRLVSSVFLHAGYLHVFFNTYVLFALGGFFNKILGEVRFLCVFFISGLTGSLASIFLGKSHVSVGASGAIWGLFGSSLVLALFKTGYLPEAIRVRLKRITFINLLINLGVSFLPMVDFWAHIGGGIGGFFATLFLVFEPKKPFLYNLKNKFLTLLTIVLIFCYGFGIAWGLYKYRPWSISFNISLKEIKLNEVPFTVSVPSDLQQNEYKKIKENIFLYSFGDPRTDRLILEYFFFKEKDNNLSDNWLRSQQDVFLSDDTTDPEIKKSLRLINSQNGLILSYDKKMGPSHRAFTYFMIRGSYIIRCSMIINQKTGFKELDKLRDKILQGIKSAHI